MLAKKHKIIAVDCDVDAPNLGLVLGVKKFKTSEKIQTSEKAVVTSKTCPECKKDINVCIFGAIDWDEKNKKLVINRFLCEGCGACLLAFPKGSVKLIKVQNATINTSSTKYGFPIVSGQLKMGESGSGKVVTAVKNKAEQLAKKEKADIMLVDSSPGIGCPVIASIQGSDYVIAVTEPTPSALNDLKRVLAVVEHFKIPYGIVINKYDINPEFSKRVEQFAKNKNIKMLGKIKYNRKFVDALVSLTPAVVYEPKFERTFNNILSKLNF